MFSIVQSMKWVGIAAIVGLVIFSLWYISSLKAELAISIENTKTLTSSVKTQQLVLQKIKGDILHIQKINTDISKVASEHQSEISNLQSKFDVRANNEQRDLGNIARSKSQLTQKIINAATARVNRCFELATGADIRKGEVNNECKNIINTLTK